MRLAQKYNIYRDIALEKCLAEGLDDEDILDGFLGLIEKDNYEKVYSRREEIILSLGSRECPEAQVQLIINRIYKRIIRFADSRMAMMLYLSEPLFCIEEPIEKYIGYKDRDIMFSKLKEKNDTSQFCLIYQALDFKNLAQESLMLNRHLIALKELILTGSRQPYVLYTLSHLLMIMINLPNHEGNRESIITLFGKILSRDDIGRDLENILLNNIISYNTFLKSKIAYLGRSLFVRYKYCKRNQKRCIEMQYPRHLAYFEACCGDKKLSQVESSRSSHTTTKVYELESHKAIKISAEYKNIYYETILS